MNNNDIKVSLTIELEGSTLHKEEEVTKSFELTKKDLNPTISLKDKDCFKVVLQGNYTVIPLVAKPCYKTIKMTRDAYDYFISDNCPEWEKKQHWCNKTPMQRLVSHLKRTSDNFEGKSFTFNILDD